MSAAHGGGGHLPKTRPDDADSPAPQGGSGTGAGESVEVTTWYLEQTSPHDLQPAKVPDDPALHVARAEVPSPEFSRFLYTAVGGDVNWTDRLVWRYEEWRDLLERPGVETWVAYLRGTPAGFIELGAGAEGSVEIDYFGLIPTFRGYGLGGHLLSVGTARAWDLATRWPERTPTRRVWVHTCSQDGPHALTNYQRRGFHLYDTKVGEEPLLPNPGYWPGA